MPNTEIVSYINDQTQQGIAKDAIREALLQSGWAADAVEEGFATVDGHSGSPFPSAATVATAAITEKDYPVTLLWAFKSPIIFGLFLIVLFVVGYYSLPLVFFAIFLDFFVSAFTVGEKDCQNIPALDAILCFPE